MSVTVDQKPLACSELGLETVGQVLSHVQKDNRLVVQILIDGQQPDLGRLTAIKRSSLQGHTLYIETAEPRRMALEVLTGVEEQLDQTDKLKSEAADLLQKNQTVKAMELLSGCFTVWQAAQESILKTAQLLRIDLAAIEVAGVPLKNVLDEFAQQLREVRTTLENRDYVGLADILLYETTQTSTTWRAALTSMRGAIGG